MIYLIWLYISIISIYLIYSIDTSIHEWFFSTPVALCSKWHHGRWCRIWSGKSSVFWAPVGRWQWFFFFLTLYPEKQKQRNNNSNFAKCLRCIFANLHFSSKSSLRSLRVEAQKSDSFVPSFLWDRSFHRRFWRWSYSNLEKIFLGLESPWWVLVGLFGCGCLNPTRLIYIFIFIYIYICVRVSNRFVFLKPAPKNPPGMYLCRGISWLCLFFSAQ